MRIIFKPEKKHVKQIEGWLEGEFYKNREGLYHNFQMEDFSNRHRREGICGSMFKALESRLLHKGIVVSNCFTRRAHLRRYGRNWDSKGSGEGIPKSSFAT